MIKKIIALAATALFSSGASAGLVQYNLSPVTSSMFLSGPSFIIQHDDDKSIAFYSISTPWGIYTPRDHFEYMQGNLISASNNFADLAPTSFIASLHSPEISDTMSLSFSDGATAGTFNFSMTVTTGPGPYAYQPLPPQSYYYAGTASVGPVDPWWLEELSSTGGYYQYINQIIPTTSDQNEVPEPTSLALLAVGALGAAGAARRRKATH